MNLFVFIVFLHYLSLFSSEDTSAIFNKDEWIQIDESRQSSISPPPPITYEDQDSQAKIFIAIAAFRDNRCSITLKNLFTKAKYPNRINIGLVEQIHTEEDNSDCITAYCTLMNPGHNPAFTCPHKNQINRVVFSYLDSRGPAFSRALQTQLLQDEEFCMQVDSHVDVVQDWDIQLINMWQSTENEYGILSTVPPDLPMLGKNFHDHFEVPHICQATFTDSGLIRNLSPRAAMNLKKPILTSLWSAGFSFSKCHAEIKTPYDPRYLYIYDGEEFSKYARLWTRGYDVYTPSRILIAHDAAGKLNQNLPSAVNSKVNPLAWVENGMKDTYRWQMFEESRHRIHTLLGMPDGDKDAEKVSMLTKYGLGFKRTLTQFIQFTGVDTKKLKVFEDRCKQLEWVPFKPDLDPTVDTSDVWGNQPETLLSNGPNIPLISGSIAYKTFDVIRSTASSDSTSSQSFSHNIYQGNSIHFESKDIQASIDAAKGELWWIFQSIDRAVESAILQVDREVGSGHGHRVLKLILLIAPVFIFVLYAAIRILMNGKGGLVRGDIKKI